MLPERQRLCRDRKWHGLPLNMMQHLQMRKEVFDVRKDRREKERGKGKSESLIEATKTYLSKLWE